MVISAVIYIMPHRQCSPALWMMVCFIQRTKSCPSRVGRFQHNGKKKKTQNKTPAKWSADESDSSEHSAWELADSRGLMEPRACQELG